MTLVGYMNTSGDVPVGRDPPGTQDAMPHGLFEIDLREDIETMFIGDQRLPDKHTTPTCQILDSGTQTLSSTSHCMPENLLEVPSPSTGVVWENSSVASDPSPQHSHEG